MKRLAHGTCDRMVKQHILKNLIIYAFLKKATAVRRRYYRQQQALMRHRLTEGIYVCPLPLILVTTND